MITGLQSLFFFVAGSTMWLDIDPNKRSEVVKQTEPEDLAA